MTAANAPSASGTSRAARDVRSVIVSRRDPAIYSAISLPGSALANPAWRDSTATSVDSTPMGSLMRVAKVSLGHDRNTKSFWSQIF